MTRSFCTLFDKNYLFQGVALHDSLLRHAGEFRLYALAMDDESFSLLQRLGRPSLIPVRLVDLLDEQVAAVRARTTHGQFCWACQPLICRHVIERYGADMVTYLESDSLFFSTPEPLFAELGSRSVSLVPHNFSSEFDNTQTAGRFCVQFNAFRNDAAARVVLDDWRANCFRYDKSAPGLYPGQTCLDEWPARFAEVHVIEHLGAGVAPWNVRGYELSTNDSTPLVDGVPVVFFHYHQYGRFASGAHELGSYPLTPQIIDLFYRPYVNALRQAEQNVRAVDPGFTWRRVHADGSTLPQLLRAPSRARAASYLAALKRKLRGRFNVYPDAYFPDEARGGQP